MFVSARHDDEFRATLLGLGDGLRRVNAPFAGLITGSGDYTTGTVEAHRNRFASKLRIVSLLYCRKESIHVNVYDFSLFHLSCCLFAYLQFCFRMQKYTLFMKGARIRKEIMGYRHKKRQIPICLGICLDHLWEMII